MNIYIICEPSICVQVRVSHSNIEIMQEKQRPSSSSSALSEASQTSIFPNIFSWYFGLSCLRFIIVLSCCNRMNDSYFVNSVTDNDDYIMNGRCACKICILNFFHIIKWRKKIYESINK